MNSSNYAKFNNSFRWALIGSLIYELTKSLHNLLLLNLLPSSTYGLFGSLISTVFMILRLTEIGLSNSIAPFLKDAMSSKQSFNRIILKLYLPMHLPVQVVVLSLFPLIASTILHIDLSLPMAIIIVLLILVETLRSFERLLLHATYNSKTVVQIELMCFTVYIIGTLTSLVVFKLNPPISFLLFSLLLDSIICVSVLTVVIIKKIYIPLKNIESDFSINKIKRRILKARLFNSALRLSREFFTSNFLTPFFLAKFGSHQAGIFFFASSISYSALSIFRSTINYPGTALLASYKDSPQSDKKHAFHILGEKFVQFILPPAIFFIINFQFLIKLSYNINITLNIIALVGLFLTITIFDLFSMLYEQFYIIEELSSRFLGFKLIEFLLFYFFIINSTQATVSVAVTLLSILMIKLASFTLIATDAYIQWKIIPAFKTTKKNLLLTLIISIISYLLFLKLT